ncbi:MAG: hypothetical protein EOO43_07790 [Flavobacterium sp.]|nr:MAG: hypothetical protein EOO43_07790 [Flavobacterium sp.]
MKKRNDLSILFSLAAKISGTTSIARDTHTEHTKAKLHKAYDREKLLPLLDFLYFRNRQLHLCCLLTYGCWLKPHVEVLSLTTSNFKNQNTEIHLSGHENKGGRVRVVYVPDYVLKHLVQTLSDLEDNINIFSRLQANLNQQYFITFWKRLRKDMLAKWLIEDGQTIYSFRHS